MHVLHEEGQVWVELLFVGDSVDHGSHARHDSSLEVAGQLSILMQAVALHVVRGLVEDELLVDLSVDEGVKFAHGAEKVVLRQLLRACLNTIFVAVDVVTILPRHEVQLVPHRQISRQTVDAQDGRQCRGHVLLPDCIGLGVVRLGDALRSVLTPAATANFPHTYVVIVNLRVLVDHSFNLFTMLLLLPLSRLLSTSR